MLAVLLAQVLLKLFARQTGVEQQLLARDAERVHQIVRAALAASSGEDRPSAEVMRELNQQRANAARPAGDEERLVPSEAHPLQALVGGQSSGHRGRSL